MNLNVLTNVVVTEFPKILLGSGHRRCWGAGGVDHVTKLTQSCISLLISAKIPQSHKQLFSSNNSGGFGCYFVIFIRSLVGCDFDQFLPPGLLCSSPLFLSRSQVSVLWRRNNQSSEQTWSRLLHEMMLHGSLETNNTVMSIFILTLSYLEEISSLSNFNPDILSIIIFSNVQEHS